MLYLFGSHRYLCVSVALPSYTFLVLNLHVPDKTKGFDVIESYRKEVEALLKKYKMKLADLVFLADLNQRLGSCV